MYCDAQGRPDPNGNYQLIDGKLVLRRGAVSFDITLIDSASPGATLTEAEKSYAIAAAKEKHDLRHRYLPASERPAFSAEQETAVIAAAKARKVAAQQTPNTVEVAQLRSVATAQRAARKYVAANAWRG